MVLYFDNCDVAINRSGIMATSAALSLSNSINPTYSIGHKGTLGINPEGSIKSIVQINYIPEINNEPSYWIAENLKTLVNNVIYSGVRIELGGITQDFWFLTSYSLKMQPNGVPEVNVQYENYWPICNPNLNFKEGRFAYDTDGSIPHAWKTDISLTGSNGEVYEFNYTLKANWQPVYVISNKYPVQMELMGGEESFDFSTNLFRNILFTGENLINNFITSGTSILLQDLSLLCVTSGCSQSALTFNTSGAKIQQSNVEFQIGDIVRTNILAQKYF